MNAFKTFLEVVGALTIGCSGLLIFLACCIYRDAKHDRSRDFGQEDK